MEAKLLCRCIFIVMVLQKVFTNQKHIVKVLKFKGKTFQDCFSIKCYIAQVIIVDALSFIDDTEACITSTEILHNNIKN